MKRTCGSLLLVALAGCNGHPIEPLDTVVTATQRQVLRLPDKTKLDFLFVVDSSSSMCQEQDNLGRNFSAFAALFDDLGEAADYRIAVTSMDMANAGQRGRLQASPAKAEPQPTCNFDIPNTADCPADLPLILRSGRAGNIADSADLERKFRCMATLGTRGNGFEMGLESMRSALSCRGPNAALFGECCAADGEYDPTCAPAIEPDFLRPDAMLVVVFISDEDDCSDPDANPGRSRRAICKYGPADGDGDGIPDGYRDPALCAGDPAGCFRSECGDLGATACQARRCQVDKTANSHCEWQRDILTPVDDYYRFLAGLKPHPQRSIVVATIVGERAYTTDGAHVLTWQLGAVEAGCDPQGEGFDPATARTQACCPEGRCTGEVQPSCKSANGEAYAGRRYLQLAERFGVNGVGCPEGMEGEDGACLSICTAEFSRPLGVVKERIRGIVASYCLDKRPACQVEGRACETDAERRDPANRPVAVRRRCLRDESQGGVCETIEDRRLGSDEYRLILNAQECGSAALVKLAQIPQGGSEVHIDYAVEVGD